ncbi:MAG: flavin reductase [Firmicutes bacterium]|nr:flavin reductase [Bacillota bacterium]
MKRNLGALPAVFPMPVLMVAAYDAAGNVGIMNAAWGMMCGRDKIALCIGEAHKTTKNIRESKAFSVALADLTHMAESDFFGIATGNTMPGKFAKSGMTAVKSNYVNAPVVTDYPLVMECELLEIVESEHLHAVVGRIVNVAAEESVLDAEGKVDVTKLNALIFDQFRAGYYLVGEQVGQAWDAGMEMMK